MDTMHARVLAYKGHLIVELLTLSSIKDQVHTSLDNAETIGQVIMHTDKHLGVSKEAIELIKQIKLGAGSVGDVDWFESVAGDTFAWLGGPATIVDINTAKGSRHLSIRSYIEIPNEPPEGAMAVIDA